MGVTANSSVYVLLIVIALDTVATGRLLSREDSLLHVGRVHDDVQNATLRDYTFIHIPKTGGESFLLDSPLHMPVGSSMVGNRECMFSATTGDPNDMVVLLRNPVKHVLSQFLECKYDEDWGVRVTAHTKFPRGDPDSTNVYDGFEEWVDHFLGNKSVAGGKPFAYNCYDPRNRQVRTFASRTKSTQCRHWLEDEADLHLDVNVAKENLKSVGFVGITDYYDTSLCLFEYRAVGNFQKWRCSCDGSKLRIGSESHDSHHVPKHSIDDLSDELLAKVHDLVEDDVKLYHFALQLFRGALEDVLETTGVDLLCGQDFEEVNLATPNS